MKAVVVAARWIARIPPANITAEEAVEIFRVFLEKEKEAG